METRQIDPIARAEATLRRLAVIAERNPIYLPLFDWWASEAEAIRAEATAATTTGQRAAKVARDARYDADVAALLA